MTKSSTRQSPTQANEEPRPRHRNVYDYDGEYEFLTAQHWTTPDETARRRDGRTGQGNETNIIMRLRRAHSRLERTVDA